MMRTHGGRADRLSIATALLVASLLAPTVLAFTGSERQLAFLGHDSLDFVRVVANMLSPPYLDPFKSIGGTNYGWPFFTLGALLYAPLKLLGVDEIPAVPVILSSLTIAFTLACFGAAVRLCRRLFPDLPAAVAPLVGLTAVLLLGGNAYCIHPDSLAVAASLWSFALVLEPPPMLSERRLGAAAGALLAVAVWSKPYFACSALLLLPLLAVSLAARRGVEVRQMLRSGAGRGAALGFVAGGIAATLISSPYLPLRLADFCRGMLWDLTVHSPVQLSLGENLWRWLTRSPELVVMAGVVALPAWRRLRSRETPPHEARPVRLLEIGAPLFAACYMIFLVVTTRTRGFVYGAYALPASTVLAPLAVGAVSRAVRVWLRGRPAVWARAFGGLAFVLLLAPVVPVRAFLIGSTPQATAWRLLDEYAGAGVRIGAPTALYVPERFADVCLCETADCWVRCQPDILLVPEDAAPGFKTYAGAAYRHERTLRVELESVLGWVARLGLVPTTYAVDVYASPTTPPR